MHQTVQVASALLDLFSHIIIDLHVEDVRDKVQCILIVLNFGVQSRQVESVREIIFVNFAEVLISSCRYEL